MPSEEPHCAYFIRPQIYAKACSTQKIESKFYEIFTSKQESRQ